MTTLTFSTPPARPLRFKSGFEFISAFVAGIREGREIAGRYNQLSRLSNGQLAALGIERSQVPQVAVLGADAR